MRGLCMQMLSTVPLGIGTTYSHEETHENVLRLTPRRWRDSSSDEPGYEVTAV